MRKRWRGYGWTATPSTSMSVNLVQDVSNPQVAGDECLLVIIHLDVKLREGTDIDEAQSVALIAF